MSASAESDKRGKIGVVLLAAGASTRLGQPKQLVYFDGQTLIRRAAESALAALALLTTAPPASKTDSPSKERENNNAISPSFVRRGLGSGSLPPQGREEEVVIVVLGANSERIAPELENLPIRVTVNPDWQTGMASSLRMGLAELEVVCPDVSAALLLLCDTPFVTSEALARLLTAFQTFPLSIAAAEYGDAVGVPAVFARALFPQLKGLQGDVGARKVITTNPSNVLRVPLPEAAFDVDTPDMLSRLSLSSHVIPGTK